MRPRLAERLAVAAGDVDTDDRAGHRVEAGGEHDRVELHRLAAARPGHVDSGLGDGRDRLGVQIDEADVREVVRLVVAGVEAGSLRREVVVGGAQHLSDGGVVHDRADLAVDEAAHRVVRLGVDAHVVVRLEECQFAALPHLLERGLTLLVGHGERTGVGRGPGHADARVAGLLPVAGGILAVLGEAFLGDRSVVSGDREVGGALEHGQLIGLRRDDRDRLDAGRPGADHGDTLAGEVDTVVGPTVGEVDLASEPLGSLDVGDLRHRQAAGGHHIELRRHVGARVGVKRPPIGVVVPVGGRDAGAESDVASQVVLVGHELGVAEDLGLRGVPLRPGPLILEFGVPAVGVVDREDVAAGARVPVPVPGTADVVAGLEDHSAQAGAAHPDQLVHPGEPGADDHHVDLGGVVLRHLIPLRSFPMSAPDAQRADSVAPGTCRRRRGAFTFVLRFG